MFYFQTKLVLTITLYWEDADTIIVRSTVMQNLMKKGRHSAETGKLIWNFVIDFTGENLNFYADNAELIMSIPMGGMRIDGFGFVNRFIRDGIQYKITGNFACQIRISLFACRTQN